MSSVPSTDAALLRRLRACLARAVAQEGVAFRSVGMRYATEQDLLGGHGAGLYGGRWNPPGLRAVYASGSPLTAVREAYQHFLVHGLDPSLLRPRVLVGLRFTLSLMLDLEDDATWRHLSLSRRAVLGEAWHAVQEQGGQARSQRLGSLAALAGFEALRVPSAQDPAGWNLVVFPDALREASALEVIAREDLPPHPALP